MAPRGARRMGLLLAVAGAALLGVVRGASRTQQTYWFNEVTKVTQWEEPPKYEFIDDKTGHTYWVDPDTQESVWEKPASLSWKQLKDKDGHAYFWNEVMKESQWEKPAVLAWTEHSAEEEL